MSAGRTLQETDCVCGCTRDNHGEVVDYEVEVVRPDACFTCRDCDEYRPNEEGEPDTSGSWL